MSTPNKPGFVIPQQQTGYHPQQPGYPPQQANYVPQQQAAYVPQQYPQATGYPPPPAYQHQPFPAPIQQQPGFGGQPHGEMPLWSANTDFQVYLRDATSFHVKQKVELLEALVGWETPNKYTVKDQSGHKVFYVGEETGCCNRQFCQKARPFTLNVKDSRGVDILTFDRPLDCACFCGLFCPDSLTVSTPRGQVLGSVQEEFDLLYPKYKLKNAAGQTVLKIEGPFCPMAFNCTQTVFRVLTVNGVSVGTISKEWSGFVRELFTDADYFSMSFPQDLDISMKAVCLGALFLIDYNYFEAGGSGGGQGGRRLFG